MNVLLGFSEKAMGLSFVSRLLVHLLFDTSGYMVNDTGASTSSNGTSSTNADAASSIPEDFAVVNTQPSAFIDNLWIEFL